MIKSMKDLMVQKYGVSSNKADLLLGQANEAYAARKAARAEVRQSLGMTNGFSLKSAMPSLKMSKGAPQVSAPEPTPEPEVQVESKPKKSKKKKPE